MDRVVSPAFFAWCQSTLLSSWINASGWTGTIAAAHVAALAVLMTAAAIVDLRILGWIRRDQSVTEVHKALGPSIRVSLALAIVSAAAYFTSHAVECGHSTAFLVATVVFVAAVWTQTTIVRKATGARELAPVRYRTFAAYLSLLSWIAVAIAERGFAVLP